ncbi:MAG: histidine kinase, partial [Bacteroidota bacterium]
MIPFAFVVCIIAIGVALLHQKFRDKLIRQRLQQEELKNRHQQELLRSAIAVQEMERQRFARDLHDELGSMLAAGRMNTEQLELSVGNDQPARKAELSGIKALFQTALDATRRISHALLPPELVSLGLERALRNQSGMLTSGGIAVSFDMDEAVTSMPWEVQLACYRVCMSSL